MKKIVAEQRIIARDQNKVFVETTRSRLLSAADAVSKYTLDRGKANACVEFDIQEDRLKTQRNKWSGLFEYYIEGDVDLAGLNADGFENY